MKLEDFYQMHQGETCVIASLGPNLKLTPPGWFNYPTFGINTIYKVGWDTPWEPTYYVGVDHRLQIEDGDAIVERYAHIPKFIPHPDRDSWQGPNFYRFYHRNGEIYIGGHLPTDKDALTTFGIAYRRILGAVFQVAYWMGFTRMLVIGLHHKPGDENEHAWGTDLKGFKDQPANLWFDEYHHWANLGKAEVLNISEDTYVPDSVIQRDDWRNWASVESKTLAMEYE